MRLGTAAFMAAGLVALNANGTEAQVIIDNGTVQLGINPSGNLIYSGIGLNFLKTTAASGEALTPGCDCEGWGVADLDTGEYGKAGADFGYANIASSTVTATGTGTDPASSGSAATAVAEVVDGGLSLRVTHDFMPSVSDNLYQVDVLIENIGTGTVDELVYRRTMDWDVPPTEFDEFVTIQGWPATNLIASSDDGFADGDPNDPLTTLASDAVLNGNFTDSGPYDHGAAFDFGFGVLAAGESQEFKIFYGAAASEADAMVALSDVGAEVYSLGQPDTPDGPTLGEPNTFIFAFSGVGGTPVGGSAATTPLNFAGDLAHAVVDHHVDRTAQRMDALAFGRPDAAMSTQGAAFTPAGFDGVGVQIKAGVYNGSFTATTNNVGLDYDSRYFAISVDRQLAMSGTVFASGMIGFSIGRENVSATRADGLGTIELTDTSYALYAGAGDPAGAFVDATVLYTSLDYSQTRTGMMATYNSSPAGRSYGGRLRGGFNLPMSEKSNAGGDASGDSRNRQSVGVYAEWDVRRTAIDSFSEDNNGLTTAAFSDVSNELGFGMRYVFEGYGRSGKLFGDLDVAVLKDMSGESYSVTQTTVGGTVLTRIVDGFTEPYLRGSMEVGFASLDGWNGSARLGGRFSGRHSELEAGLQLMRQF